jgi:hypothetical protein
MAEDRLESSYNNSKFRTSFTQKEGHVAARVIQGSVLNVNLKNWTVDILAQYDRKYYFNIQVSSPYLHHSNGEGIYVMPEVGATAMICLPSDSSAPFVLAFIMPTETIDASADDAPAGTTSHGQMPPNPTDSSYSGGRPQAQLGDIWMRTRDGNFVILHRGGVLQVGATGLAQRIYIPLNNLITDISENYEHHNSNGSIVWGLQEGPSQTQIASQYMQTYRVFTTDQYADIKLAVGRVYNPIAEPDGGQTLALTEVGEGDDPPGTNPIIYELTVSPMGFVAESGAIVGPSTISESVMKFTFDRMGNTLLRTEGNLTVQVAKQLTFLLAQPVSFQAQQSMSMAAKTGMDIDGGEYAAIKGTTVRLGAGARSVARVGDMVTIPMTTPISITFASTPQAGQPAVGVITVPLAGAISTGNANVLA